MNNKTVKKIIGNWEYGVVAYDDLETGKAKEIGSKIMIDIYYNHDDAVGCIEAVYNPSNDFLQIVYYRSLQNNPDHHDIAKYLMEDFLERAKEWKVTYILVEPYPAEFDSANEEEEVSDVEVIKEKLYKVYERYGFELEDGKMYLK